MKNSKKWTLGKGMMMMMICAYFYAYSLPTLILYAGFNWLYLGVDPIYPHPHS